MPSPSYQSPVNNFSSVSKGFQPKFAPKFIQSFPNSNSQTNPKFQKDYKAEYKKDEKEVSDEEKVTHVKVLMALADDELTVGKSHARDGEWVDITIRKVNTLLSTDEDVDWKNYRYSFILKAFRVYNTRRQQIEETYHITCDESMEAIRNKKDEHGTTTKRKVRLVAQSYSQEEGIDYNETFAPVARMESIKIFLAFAIYMNFKVYQMDVKSSFLNVKTPMVPPNNLGPDLSGKPVNETSYRGMIGLLMYLTVTRPDIQFSTILYVRYQSNPKESHLIAVKRILRYLKGTPTLGLYYPKCSGFDLKGYSDSDYNGCNMDRKSTSGACKYLVEN
nr:retrovirus-related Pol polyprotein from transposon TNT 1-94 [Tanacetum cinerariifolium]